jgi:hypothetical protein
MSKKDAPLLMRKGEVGWPTFAPEWAERGELTNLPMRGAVELILEKVWTVPNPNERYDGDGEPDDFPIFKVVKGYSRRDDFSEWHPSPAEVRVVENPLWALDSLDLARMLREAADVIEQDAAS